MRILIVRLSHLGDVVHALPLLSALRAAHPTARIAWAVQPEFADLLRDKAELDQVVLFDRRGGAAAWARLRFDLEAFGAEWAIDAQGNVKSALISLASGAPRRSGFARADWTERFAASSLTDPAPPASRAEDGVTHAMERMAALVGHVTPSTLVPMSRPTSPSSSATSQSGEHELAEWFGAARGPFVVLHLSDEHDVRAWRTGAFVELARDLARECDVLVLAGPGERAEGLAAQRELADVARVRCVTDQSALAALDAFLHAAARRQAVFVGCDSGPMHLAWAAGMRVVLLAGPQDERRTGPWPVARALDARGAGNEHHFVVRAEVQPACAPCLSRKCTHSEGNVCMTRMAPARVASAVRAAIGMARDDDRESTRSAEAMSSERVGRAQRV